MKDGKEGMNDSEHDAFDDAARDSGGKMHVP